MNKPHYIYVCVTCDVDKQKADTSMAQTGKEMLSSVKKAVKNLPEKYNVRVKSVKCMGGCDHACSVGFTANGKQSCLFVNMQPNKPEEVLEVLKLHIKSPIGRIKMDSLSKELQPKYLCRIPQPLKN